MVNVERKGRRKKKYGMVEEQMSVNPSPIAGFEYASDMAALTGE